MDARGLTMVLAQGEEQAKPALDLDGGGTFRVPTAARAWPFQRPTCSHEVTILA